MRTAGLRLLPPLAVLAAAVSLPADEAVNRARASLRESEAEARARPLVEAELAKMADMTPEQSFSYLRTESTQWMMSLLAAALETYRSKRGRYPAADSITELESALFPEFTSEVPKSDRWGTEFRYAVSRNGKSYKLISAGSDTIFDERSWATSGELASADDDAVVENGRPVRVWTTATQPGLGVLAKLRPEARARLSRADKRRDADDYAGALEAYMEAVDLDPAAADLERIGRYAVAPTQWRRPPRRPRLLPRTPVLPLRSLRLRGPLRMRKRALRKLDRRTLPRCDSTCKSIRTSPTQSGDSPGCFPLRKRKGS